MSRTIIISGLGAIILVSGLFYVVNNFTHQIKPVVTSPITDFKDATYKVDDTPT